MANKTGRFTYLLRWNPDISSVTMDHWKNWMDHFRFMETNWSVHDWEEADYGDRFYMLKVGSGRQGIVMHGGFTSLPYLGYSWRNDGSRVFYRDIEIWHILDPENGPIIPIEELQKAMPEVDWENGHSGVLLTVDQQLTLNELWDKFADEHEDIMEQQGKMWDYYIEPSAAARIQDFQKYHEAVMCGEDYDFPLTESCMHDCFNRDFTEDLDYEEFRITLWFNVGKNITFRCTGLDSIKVDLSMREYYWHLFMIFEEGPDFLHLRANGVDVVCKEIAVEKIEDCK